MAFKLITGKMGSGKSYWGVEICQKAMAENAIVHTNLAFRDEWLSKHVDPELFVRLSDDFTTWRDQLRAGREGYENVLVVDESAIMFNAREFNKAKDEKADVFAFMVHARKLGLDVYFISQSAKNVDSQLRRMAENEMQCLAVKRIPAIGPLLVPIFGDFRRFICTPDGREVMESHWARCKPEVYEAYETDAMHGNNLGIQRDVRRTKSTGRVWTAPMITGMAVLLAVAVAVLWSGKSIYGLIEKRLPGGDKTVGEAVAVPQALPPVPPSVVSDAARPPAPELPQPDPEPQDLILQTAGRGFDGRFRLWVREWGEISAGSVMGKQRVTGILLEGREYVILIDDKTRRPVRRATPQDQPKWNTKASSFGPPAWAPSSSGIPFPPSARQRSPQ